MQILIQPDAAAATELVARIIQREVLNNPCPVLGLATGRTMEPVYAHLVRMHLNDSLDFSACQTFNLDEYVGLPDRDRNSYRHYMNDHLFSHVNIDPRNTHLLHGMAADLNAECESFEHLISQAGGIDLQLLGIGLSGHIGFNEPLSAFKSRTRVVPLAPMTLQQNAPVFGKTERVPRLALTMGLATILDCRRCVLLATGEEKAEIIAKAVEGPLTAMVPASALQTHPNCLIVTDDSAAARLTKQDYYLWTYEHEPKWDWLRKISAVSLGEDCAPATTLMSGHLETAPQPLP
ncbi:MAG: glucosamine-6-phosphate deaminase [Verrucomicrobiota bacterium]|jgi:glucosamine-6-phosphate deaminase